MQLIQIHSRLKWSRLVPVAGLLVVIAVVFLFDTVIPSAARRALPSTATNIQEYYSNSWNGDFVRLVKATLPENDYLAFANRLGLNTRFDSTVDEDIRSMVNMLAGDEPDWWNPPSASKQTFFEYKRGGDFLQVLNYYNGSVYFLITSW